MKERKKRDLSTLVPPGSTLRYERNLLLVGLALAALWSASFLLRYFTRWGELRRSEALLVPPNVHMSMPPFAQMIRWSFLGFGFLAIALLAAVVSHYLSYFRESKSIYLMRRLPDRGLLHRQCWTLPLIGLAVTALTSLVLLGLYYLIYHVVTPAAWLSAG